MDQIFFDTFKRKVNKGLYQVINQPTDILLKEENYEFHVTIPPLDGHTVTLRLEDMKEQANYLNGGKRAAGKDYDLAIISDDCVYQIEVKKGDQLGGHSPNKQLTHGAKWLKHLLEMSNEKEHRNIKNKIDIFLYLPTCQRASRIRTPYQVYLLPDKPYAIVEVSSPLINKINLDDLFKRLYNAPQFAKDFW